ncbi:MAG TPA: hypothetical protein VNO17_09510 [Actinomycetota bacterium]|nr:hypothetical protein [Actinomycetota bacterium]
MDEPELARLLLASGPFDADRDRLMLYGRFVGSWDVEATWFADGRPRARNMGEWHFQWILGGRGVQDVLFRAGSPAHSFGTTLRCYESGAGVWHVVWMQPASREFVYLLGWEADDGILQEVQGLPPGRRERWRFTEITPVSFRWLGEVSHDGGATWILEQEMRARRR